jgi:hypothetical protein
VTDALLLTAILAAFSLALAWTLGTPQPRPVTRPKREHDLTGRECWCEPRLVWACPVCNGLGTRLNGQPCLACDGTGETTRPDRYRPCIIIHDEHEEIPWP